MWLTSISYLSEVCAYLGDHQKAKILYNLLKPYDGRTLFAGYSEVSFGAISRFLGLLAITTAQWDHAEKHLQDAIRLNRRFEMWTWLAHTQYIYAVLLLMRPKAKGSHNDRDEAFTLLEEILNTIQYSEMVALKNKINYLIENFEGV
jgi:hypothetical protein